MTENTSNNLEQELKQLISDVTAIPQEEIKSDANFWRIWV